MSAEPNSLCWPSLRGKVFEIVCELADEFPERVNVIIHPTQVLYGWPVVIPDLEFSYYIPPTTHCILIECQSRERS